MKNKFMRFFCLLLALLLTLGIVACSKDGSDTNSDGTNESESKQNLPSSGDENTPPTGDDKTPPEGGDDNTNGGDVQDGNINGTSGVGTLVEWEDGKNVDPK